MKAVILAGGFGTRMAEETDQRPKPMIEIGGRPLLWHIMKIYSHHGIDDFIVCLGYKGYFIKEYFLNFHAHNADLSIDLATGDRSILAANGEKWRVTLVDTGADTMTGGRLGRVARHLDGGTFCLTYGDGLTDADLGREIAFHKSHGKLATLLAVMPPGRYGMLGLDNNRVVDFREKPKDEFGYINGGFFVLEPGVLKFIDGDRTVWEKEPLETLSRQGQLEAFQHQGFWRPCDTLRDKRDMEDIWQAGAPWKVWSA